jgi:molybdate transport system regulatory protein
MARVTIELKPRLMVRGERAIGPGKANLLDKIKETRSISGAARAMKMSYRRAWQLVDTMNRSFKTPLVEAETGGKRGGGARVTVTGEAVLANYRAMQAALDAEAGRHLGKLATHLK